LAIFKTVFAVREFWTRVHFHHMWLTVSRLARLLLVEKHCYYDSVTFENMTRFAKLEVNSVYRIHVSWPSQQQVEKPRYPFFIYWPKNYHTSYLAKC